MDGHESADVVPAALEPRGDGVGRAVRGYAVVAGALGTAMGQATVMQTLTLIHLEKQKKALAAMPKPEPPPAQP